MRASRRATLRESLAEAVRAPLKRLRGKHSAGETILALDDISFEVQPGEVLGIIGRNGAGKSTLLKILSRITEPTRGRVELYGRVESLLEVGTGFHPELTGRENIFLNGAILGMKRAEIARNFDKIVAFAEVEKFIDTPVKHYSSGMYVRLAFAVAAHLDPDVLIVDEVLSVGDTAFQRKCLRKMQDVTQEGRTVLFVSHSIAAIKSLCNRAILLESGRVVLKGDVDHVVDSYLMGNSETPRTGIIPDDAPRLYGTGEAKIRSVQLKDLSDNRISQLYLGQQFRVTLIIDALTDIREAIIELSIAAVDRTHVTISCTNDGGNPPVYLSKGRHSVSVDIDITLLPRQYTFMLGIHHLTGATIDFIERSLDFTVLNVAQNGRDSYRASPVRGYVRPGSCWHAPILLEKTVTSGAIIQEALPVEG